MKKRVFLVTIIAIVSGLSLMIAPASIAFPHPIDTQQQIGEFGENVEFVLSNGSPEDKVTLCHKGKKTLSVNPDAVPAHLAHGDTLGPC